MIARAQEILQDGVSEVSPKQEYVPVMDFKKDALFKTILKNPNNVRTYQILKGLCREILNLEVKQIVPLNPELSPKSYNDKSMLMDSLFILDNKSILNIEMQDSPYSKDHMYRLQLYGYEMLLTYNKKGNPNYKDSIQNFFQIIFINAYDNNFPTLISDFKIRESNGKTMKHNLTNLFFVQIPYINRVVEQKGIKNLNISEAMTFMLENGEHDDIIDLDNEVMKSMYELRNEFNMEAIAKAVEHNLEMKEIANRNLIREEGIKIGEAKGEKRGEKRGFTKGIYNNQKEVTISTFKVKYPDFDFTLLENLTLEQYKAIFTLLINDKSLEEIQNILKCGK